MSTEEKSSVDILSNGQHAKDEELQTPIETIVIDPDSTIVEATACRLRTIEGLDGLSKIEMLNMRQNLIEKIENLSQLTTLKQIDLYDNHIERIEGLDTLIQLKHVDLSFSMLN
jgi:protein phosphatase 1 regulatory subunit 7